MISPDDAKRARKIGFVAQILQRLGSRNVGALLEVLFNDTPLISAPTAYSRSAHPLRVEIR